MLNFVKTNQRCFFPIHFHSSKHEPRSGVEYRLTGSAKEAEDMAKGITIEQSDGLPPVRLLQLN